MLFKGEIRILKSVSLWVTNLIIDKDIVGFSIVEAWICFNEQFVVC